VNDHFAEYELRNRLQDYLGDSLKRDPAPVVLAFKQYWRDPTMTLHDLRWMLFAEDFFETDGEFLRICFPFLRSRDMYQA
jgi:hypothetical protein